MDRYLQWRGTPTAWYSFLMIVSMPLSLLVQLVQLPGTFETMIALSATSFAWLGVLSAGLNLLNVGALVGAEIGLICKKWFGPCCVLGLYGLVIFNGLLNVLVGVMLEDSAAVIGGVLPIFQGGIFLAICSVYFYKRRALFAPPPAWLVERNRAFEVLCEERAREEKAAAESYNSLYPPDGGPK